MNASRREPEKTFVAGEYGWCSGDGPDSCNFITPAILKVLSGLGVRRILDLGAGNGKLCSELMKEGYQVVGVDFDEAGLEIARDAYPTIPFYRYGVQDDPQALLGQEGAFDAVVSTEVVEHLYSPHLLPRYAAAVLKPRGALLISTPYHGYWKNLALSVTGTWDRHHSPLWHGGHIKFWSPATLSRLLLENGFTVRSFHGVGRVPFLWKSMVLLSQRVD